MELCQQVVTVTRPGASITTDRGHADGKGTMGASSWGNSFRNCKLLVGSCHPLPGEKIRHHFRMQGRARMDLAVMPEYVQFNTYWMSCN